MDRKSLPPDWRLFLDQVETKLGILLERTDANINAWAGRRHPDEAPRPVPETLSRADAGLNERVAALEQRLHGLDGELHAVEQDAQRLQTAAQTLRRTPKAPNSVSL